MTEIEILRRRINQIDTRLAEIATRLKHVAANGFEGQEMRTECHELHGLKRMTERRIQELTQPPDPAQVERERRRQATIDVWEREQAESIRHQIARFEKAGEFRQARIHRMTLFKLRDQIAAQLQ